MCGSIDLLWPHLGHKYGHTSNNRFETFRLSRSIFDDSNTSTWTFKDQQHLANNPTSHPSTSTWNGGRQYKCISNARMAPSSMLPERSPTCLLEPSPRFHGCLVVRLQKRIQQVRARNGGLQPEETKCTISKTIQAIPCDNTVPFC